MSFQCKVCQKPLKTAQGLKSHVTRLHRDYSSASFRIEPSRETSSIEDETNGDTESCTRSGDCRDETSLVDLLANLKSSLVILRRIPKGARSGAADALSRTIEQCLLTSSVTSWERLLMFPAVCFQLPETVDERKVSLSTMVLRNITAFLDGCGLPEGKQEPQKTGRKVLDTRKVSEDSLSKCVVGKLSEGDVRGAVRVLCSEDTFAPRDAETLDILCKKHPDHDMPLNSPCPGEGISLTSLSIKEEDIKAAIAAFPAGSAGGLDMLRPQHLKDMTSHSAGPAGARLCGLLTRLSNHMLAGEVPEEICPILYGAALSAFKKNDGGIRPIAVGCTYRRLVGRMCCSHIATKLGDDLQPIQLGFAVKGGIEAASHAVRQYKSLGHASPKVLLKVDFYNAFNMVRRDLILQSVLDKTPNLYKFILQCYGKPSHLAFGKEIIPSMRGLQQGDPLGPALFCMVIQPMAQTMKSELNIWYLDDATLGGAPEVVLQDWHSLVEKSSHLGLEVNQSKCELLCLDQSETIASNSCTLFQESFPNVKIPPLHDWCILGAPLTETAVENNLTKKTKTLQLLSDRLKVIPTHCAFYILKNSVAIPKLMHVLRCSPAWKCVDKLKCFDDTLKNTLESIVNIELSETAWEQSAWPVSMGGLGIRRARQLALDAFLSSSISTSSLVLDILPKNVNIVGDDLLAETMLEWQEESGAQYPPQDVRHQQREWESRRVTESIVKCKEQAVNVKEKARLNGVSSKESGAFLNALPSTPLGTMLDGDAFRTAVALRVGANICQPHVCPCGATVDQLATHGLCCKMSRGRPTRHATVNDILKRALSSAKIPAVLEPSHLLREDNKRPDGITQIPWKNGKHLIWDFTCTDSLAPSLVDASAREPLSAATAAEKNKRRKYSTLSQNNIFIPVAVECLGAYGKEGLSFIRELGRRIGLATGEKRAGEFLIQRMSVAIQRANAISISGTLPQGSSLDEELSFL